MELTREEQINYLTENGYRLINGDKKGEECFSFISLVVNAILQKQQVFCKIVQANIKHKERRWEYFEEHGGVDDRLFDDGSDGIFVSPVEVGMFFIVDEGGVSNCFCGPLHFTPMFSDIDLNAIGMIYDMYRKDMCAVGLCDEDEDEGDCGDFVEDGDSNYEKDNNRIA